MVSELTKLAKSGDSGKRDDADNKVKAGVKDVTNILKGLGDEISNGIKKKISQLSTSNKELTGATVSANVKPPQFAMSLASNFLVADQTAKYTLNNPIDPPYHQTSG